MSHRFQNVNKYRNVVGKVARKEEWYADIPVETSSSSDKTSLISASQNWLALKWAGAGGSMALLPVAAPGKTCAKEARVFHAHGASVSDWCFSPFNNDLLATGAEDGMVKLWDVSSDEPTPKITFTTPSRRVDAIGFHPVADQIVTTLGNDGKKVCIFDAAKQDKVLEMTSTGDPFHSFAWKGDGALLSTTAKNAVNIWDPRATTQVATGAGHEGIKGSRVTWLGGSNFLFTVGLNKFRNREYALWDARDLSKPLSKSGLSASAGIMLPLYDQDTETMYLVGRGDATIRSLQMSDLIQNPSVAENMACGTSASIYGATLLPKLALDVMHTEIARVLAVVDNAVMPVSFQVPRKQYLDFHADLFPDTNGTEPALTSEAWLRGENASVARISLDPAKRRAAKPVTSPPTRAESPRGQEQDQVKNQPNPAVDEPKPASIKSPARLSGSPEPAKSAPSAAVSSAATPTENDANDIASANNTTPPPMNTSSSPAPSPVSAKGAAIAKKFGAANVNIYKYIAGKLYHPSQHFDDLRGLSIDKSGNFDLIQANTKFICVPITGPGGQVGIIPVDKPGRLPVHIPCILCGAGVTNFRLDPFDEHTLATASDDGKIRLWKIPEGGIESTDEAGSLLAATLSDDGMDKLNEIEFHPTAQNILLSVSLDLGVPTVRVWADGELKYKWPQDAKCGAILCAVWSRDGTKIATHSKDKYLRVLDARTGKELHKIKSHDGIRPSRLSWLDDSHLASAGFGLGSMREVLVFDLQENKVVGKRPIDVSPSVMSLHYDPDCRILYVAGRGDRIIHTYAFEKDGKTLDPLAKIEAATLQQSIAFLPKWTCHIRDIEIARFYRLTPTSIEPFGVRVPRARPEYFQDDIFVDTLDHAHPAQNAASWLQGETKELKRISLQPTDMTPLSQAPPPPQQQRSKEKFEMGKKMVSDDERRKNLMDRMFSTAKEVDDEDEERKRKEKERPTEDEEVAEEEWDD